MRNRLFALSLAVLAASTAPACGQVAPAAAVVSIADARSLSSQAQADINAHEFAHFATMVGALEQALANPDTPQTVKESPAIYVDGDAERLAVRAWLKSSEGEGAAARAPVIIDDPYPEIAWTLASTTMKSSRRTMRSVC